MNRTILVVEDDKRTAELIQLYLVKNDYQAVIAANGLEALDLARKLKPRLIVLDLMLPHLDGLDLCYIIRSESDVPIVMLTARTTEDDKLLGLEMGADDYISKPFSPRELMARIRAILRRTAKDFDQESNIIQIRDLFIDFMRHEVRIGGELVSLTLKEFKLLETLVKNPGRAFSRMQLVELAFGFDYEGLERTIDVHIKNLRKKIEPNPTQPTYIETVYGVGYKFTEVA